MVPVFNSICKEEEADRLLLIWVQFCLQDTQTYIEKPCLKKLNGKNEKSMQQ